MGKCRDGRQCVLEFAAAAKGICTLKSFQISSGVHLTYFSVGTGDPFFGCKGAESEDDHTCTQRQLYEWVQLTVQAVSPILGRLYFCPYNCAYEWVLLATSLFLIWPLNSIWWPNYKTHDVIIHEPQNIQASGTNSLQQNSTNFSCTFNTFNQKKWSAKKYCMMELQKSGENIQWGIP